MGTNTRLILLEKPFERLLYSFRFITLLPVIFGLLGSVILFFIASLDIAHVIGDIWALFVQGKEVKNLHSGAIASIVGAIDLYLMALVLLIFVFGVYELFISEIDAMKNTPHAKVLEVKSLDELKDKIGKVVIMVLVVNFFQRVLHQEFTGALDMIYLALSILALCLGLYFLQKGHK